VQRRRFPGNTEYLNLAVGRLRADCVAVPDETLAHVAPLG
jgi:hypothetical protein